MTARIRTHKRIEFWQTTNIRPPLRPPSAQHPPESLRSGLCGCVSVLCVSEELVRPGVAFYWRSKHLQLIGPDQNLPSYLHLPVSTTAQWRKKQTVLHSKCHVNKKLQHSATHRAPTGTSLYTAFISNPTVLNPAWF